jgi:hypothetical protein
MAEARAHKLDLGRRRAPGRRIRKRAVDGQWAVGRGIEARCSMRTVEGSKPWPGLARHDASRAGKWSWSLQCAPMAMVTPTLHCVQLQHLLPTSPLWPPFVDTVVRTGPLIKPASPGFIWAIPMQPRTRLPTVPAASERELIVDNRHACSDHGCLGRWAVHSGPTRDACLQRDPKTPFPKMRFIAAETPANHHRSRRTPPGLISNSASRLWVHDFGFCRLGHCQLKTCAYNQKPRRHGCPDSWHPARLENTPSFCPFYLMVCRPIASYARECGNKLEDISSLSQIADPNEPPRLGGRGPSKVTNTTCSCRVEQS